MNFSELLKFSQTIDEKSFRELLSLEPVYGNYIIKNGSLLEIRAKGSVLVLGDIHGDLESMKKIFGYVNLDKFLEKRENVVVFLGDYIDRGLQQVEVLALLLSLLKIYGERIILLRGNHEPPPNLTPYPHDFPYVLEKSFPGRGKEIYLRSFELFQKLPLAAYTENGTFFVHGGPPIKNLSLESLEKPDLTVLEEVLWSDPTEEIEEIERSYRGAGFLYGEKITQNFLEKNNLRVIVRGHEPCEGYKLNHGGRVVTLFSRSGSPYWNEKVGFMLLPLRETIDPEKISLYIKTL